MSWQNFFAVGWCECTVILDAGDGSMASAPRCDAALVADGRCAALAARRKGRPRLRWVTSRTGREPDTRPGFEQVCCSYRSTHLHLQGGRLRSTLLICQFAGCCWPRRGARVSAMDHVGVRLLARCTSITVCTTARRPALDGIRTLFEWNSTDAAGTQWLCRNPRQTFLVSPRTVRYAARRSYRRGSGKPRMTRWYA
jgi:hypothetical protein